MKKFEFGWKTGQFYDFCQDDFSTTKKRESSENDMKKTTPQQM